MERTRIEAALVAAVEQLAAIEHEHWAHWQRYMHGTAIKQPDGSLLIPSELVSRWEKQIATPYADLSDAEKQSDRDQVQKYLAPARCRRRSRRPAPRPTITAALAEAR